MDSGDSRASQKKFSRLYLKRVHNWERDKGMGLGNVRRSDKSIIKMHHMQKPALLRLVLKIYCFLANDISLIHLCSKYISSLIPLKFPFSISSLVNT